MQTELYSLSRLFTESLYRIPDYQRGYAWSTRQIQDFWSDLEQMHSGANHYTGVLTLEIVPPAEYAKWDDDRWIIEAKHFVPYYVVDGQQRLTTIIILLRSLIAAIGNDRQVNYTSVDEIRKKFLYESRDGGISRSFLFGYEKDNPSYEFLKTVVLEERSDTHFANEETIYTHNLLAAKKYFSEKMDALSLATLEELYTKVTQHLLFNVYAIAREIDVFVAFETMNNRGKPLSQLELLKNRLIFLSTKFNVDLEEKSRLRRTINESWKTVYHYLGKNKDRLLDDDLFLGMHDWLNFPRDGEEESNRPSRFYYRPHGDRHRNHLLDFVFTIRNMPAEGKEKPKRELTPEFIYQYAHDIKDAVKLYYEISNPSDSRLSDPEKVWLERIRRIADAEETMIVLAAYMSSTPVVVLVEFLKLFERALYIGLISPYIPRFEQLNYSRLAIQVVTKKKTMEEAIVAVEQHVTDVLKKVDLVSVLRDWGKRGGYRAIGLRYFMFEYEQELKSLSKTNREKLSWEEFAKERYEDDYSTIEHIYPQKATAECWKTAFSAFGIKQRNALRNSIGNLIPLSRPKNSSLSNKCFEEKKSNCKRTGEENDAETLGNARGGETTHTVGYIYGCYSENEVAKNSVWTAREIVERSVKLTNFMERRWQIELGERDKKVELLGLEFALESPQRTVFEDPQQEPDEQEGET